MLRLTPFTYLRASTLEEALDYQARHNGDVTLMGGGTDLLPNIKHRLAQPRFVIGLGSIGEMRFLQLDEEGWLRIGGATRLAEVEHSDIVLNRYPALAAAASLISTPQVRRMGTIAGNVCLDVRCNYYNQSHHWRRAVGYCMKKDSEICRVAPGSDRCWAISSADAVPVLIALDAQIRIVGPSGQRWEGLGGFYRDDGLVPTTIKPGEIVAEVKIPPRTLDLVYDKLRIRKSFDFPLVGAATGIALNHDGTVRRARIIVTAVGSHPLEVTEAEARLVGNILDLDVIRAAGESVFRAVHPLDNTEGAVPHRKRMARVFVERALRRFGGLDRSAT